MTRKPPPPPTLAEEIAAARTAIRRLLTQGPFYIDPATIARLEEMSDAEVLKLKYDLRDFLREVAQANELARQTKAGVQ